MFSVAVLYFVLLCAVFFVLTPVSGRGGGAHQLRGARGGYNMLKCTAGRRGARGKRGVWTHQYLYLRQGRGCVNFSRGSTGWCFSANDLKLYYMHFGRSRRQDKGYGSMSTVGHYFPYRPRGSLLAIVLVTCLICSNLLRTPTRYNAPIHPLRQNSSVNVLAPKGPRGSYRIVFM